MTSTAVDERPVVPVRRTPTVVRLLVLATFVVMLNETIMINAIPRLMSSLGITAESAQWVSTAFMLTMAAVIPVTGWLLRRVTTRRAFAIAMGAFLVGTVVSAAAPSFGVLLLGRITQASGTAVMTPLLMTTLMTVVPEADRGRVTGNLTLVMSVAPALGPVVSGLVLQAGSWRLLFVVMLPITAGVAMLGLRLVVNTGEPRPGSLDWPSAAVAPLGFGGLVYGLSQFGGTGGDVGLGVGIVAAGVATTVIFGLRQLRLQRTGSPLMDLRTLEHRTYRLALALLAIGALSMLGAMILLPLYLQRVRGLGPLDTGFVVMPGALAMGLLGPTVGKAFDRFGCRPLVLPGSIGTLLALAGFTQLSLATPYWAVLGLYVLLLVSQAVALTPSFSLALCALPAHLHAHGSSMAGTVQQVAAAFGTALVVTVLSARTSTPPADAGPALAQLDGMKLAFGIVAALSLLTIMLAAMLPRRVPASATRRGHGRRSRGRDCAGTAVQLPAAASTPPGTSRPGA